MKMERNYATSPAPAFDAVEDIRLYLGDQYDRIRDLLAPWKDCRQFRFFCVLVGIEGFPVRAWYESINGQGSWKEPEDEV